jgi:2'-5' RNA ligase
MLPWAQRSLQRVGLSRISDPIGELSGCLRLHTFDKGSTPSLRKRSPREPRPHISLAGFPGDDATPLLPQIETFAQTAAPFVVTLSALGVFPTLAGVLFLAPAPTQTLLARHRHLHELVATTPRALTPHYRPQVWVPHCTLATALQPAQIAAAVEVCMQAFTPFPVTCCEVGLIRFRPVRSIQTYVLRGR